MVKKNIVANYLGQAWRAAMGLAFLPVYIHYLGIEAYGLIGIFAILQAWFALLDFGMTPTLVREMSRFAAGAHDAQSIRNLLRTVEIVSGLIAAALALGIWFASAWLASNWVTTRALSVEDVSHVFSIMGVVTALRFVESLYASALIGLQRQVEQNLATSVLSTLRAVGAVAVLAWISPTIQAFFYWQGLLSIFTAGVMAGLVYRVLPTSPAGGRFSWSSLENIWHFAAGMVVINLFALLFTQLDKMLLARILALDAFGYYAFASTAVGILTMVVSPIATAFYPRFTELATRRDETALRLVFHQAAQMISVLVGTLGIVLVLFADAVIWVWTGDRVLAHKVAPLLAVLSLGTMLNGVLVAPYLLQIAHGWTSLTIRINAGAVLIQVPAILWAVPKYGPIAAAWVWVALNGGCLIFVGLLMYRRLLPMARGRWCVEDVLMPLTAATVAAWLCNLVWPAGVSRGGGLAFLLTTSACVLLSAGFAAPSVRDNLLRALRGTRGA